MGVPVGKHKYSTKAGSIPAEEGVYFFGQTGDYVKSESESRCINRNGVYFVQVLNVGRFKGLLVTEERLKSVERYHNVDKVKFRQVSKEVFDNYCLYLKNKSVRALNTAERRFLDG
jgi:hypothetical protein